MSEAIYTKNEKLEMQRLKRQYAATLVTVTGSATLANILISTDLGTAIQPFFETVSGVQPTPTDSGATFTTLDSEAVPGVMGILVNCGDAVRMVTKPRVTNITSATMTAGVVTLAGASTSGVTLLGNLAFTISCTTLNFNLAATTTFLLEYWYDTK